MGKKHVRHSAYHPAHNDSQVMSAIINKVLLLGFEEPQNHFSRLFLNAGMRGLMIQNLFLH